MSVGWYNVLVFCEIFHYISFWKHQCRTEPEIMMDILDLEFHRESLAVVI